MLRRLVDDLRAQLVGDLVDVEPPEQLANRGRADVGEEGVVALLLRLLAQLRGTRLRRGAGSLATSCVPGSMTT